MTTSPPPAAPTGTTASATDGWYPADYKAVRADCAGIPIARIHQLYYSAAVRPEIMPLEKFLEVMRPRLLAQYRGQAPRAASALQRRIEGKAARPWDTIALARAPRLQRRPLPPDPVGLWFGPRLASLLRADGLHNLARLGDAVRRRSNWWKPVPRMTEARAAAVVRWLQRHAAAQEKTVNPLLLRHRFDQRHQAHVLDTGPQGMPLPLGHFRLPESLDGHDGGNRHPGRCDIPASDDLAAIECYLSRFDGRQGSMRTHRDELERLVLWAALVAHKPVSSLRPADCVRFLAFIEQPSEELAGVHAGRNGRPWRPFGEDGLGAVGQRRALVILRDTFSYLTAVGYLASNPWDVVVAPDSAETAPQFEGGNSLYNAGWRVLLRELSDRAAQPDGADERAALAALLLMGDSGLHIDEVVKVTRNHLCPQGAPVTHWTLHVPGGRSRRRIVPVPARTIDALSAHWCDAPAATAEAVPRLLLCPCCWKNGHGVMCSASRAADCLYERLETVLRDAYTRVAQSPTLPRDLELPPVHGLLQLLDRSPRPMPELFRGVAVVRDPPRVPEMQVQRVA